MIRNWTILALCTSAVFACSCWAAAFVFRTTGVHVWADAQTTLRSVAEQLSVAEGHRTNLPLFDELNPEIAAIWRGTPEERKNNYNVEIELALMSFDDHRLQVWDEPPVITQTSLGPHGIGLYLLGEDGVSTAGGNDPDDINSWDPESTSFYYDRLQRRRWLRNGSWALIPTAVAFVVGWVCFVRRPNKPNKSEQDDAYQRPC